MAPEIIALILSLIQQEPAIVSAGQALLAQLEDGTQPTEAQIMALAQMVTGDRAAAEAAITTAGG